MATSSTSSKSDSLFRLPKTLKRIPKRAPSSSSSSSQVGSVRGGSRPLSNHNHNRFGAVGPPSSSRPPHTNNNNLDGATPPSWRSKSPSSSLPPHRMPVVRIRAADVRRDVPFSFKKKRRLGDVNHRRRDRSDRFGGTSGRPGKRLKRGNGVGIVGSEVRGVRGFRRLKKHGRDSSDEDESEEEEEEPENLPPKKRKKKSHSSVKTQKRSICAGPDCDNIVVPESRRFCSTLCKSTCEELAHLKDREAHKLSNQKREVQKRKKSTFMPTHPVVEAAKQDVKSKRLKIRESLASIVNPVVAKKIEKCLFKTFGGVTKEYNAKLRDILPNMRHNKDLQHRLNSGSLVAEKLLKMSSDDMASQELATQRIADEKAAMQERVTAKKITGLGKGVASLLSDRNDVNVIDVDLASSNIITQNTSPVPPLQKPSASSSSSSSTPKSASGDKHNNIIKNNSNNAGPSPIVLTLDLSFPSSQSAPKPFVASPRAVSDDEGSEEEVEEQRSIEDLSRNSPRRLAKQHRHSSPVTTSPRVGLSPVPFDAPIPTATEVEGYNDFLEQLSKDHNSTDGDDVDLKGKEEVMANETSSPSSDRSSTHLAVGKRKQKNSSTFSFNPEAPFLRTYDDCTPVWTGSVKETKVSPLFLASLIQTAGDPIRRIPHVRSKGFRQKGTIGFEKVSELLLGKSTSSHNKLAMFVLQPLEGPGNVEGYNQLAHFCEIKKKSVVFDVRKATAGQTASGIVMYLFPPISDETLSPLTSNGVSCAEHLTDDLLKQLFGSEAVRPTGLMWAIGVLYIAQPKSEKSKSKS